MKFYLLFLLLSRKESSTCYSAVCAFRLFIAHMKYNSVFLKILFSYHLSLKLFFIHQCMYGPCLISKRKRKRGRIARFPVVSGDVSERMWLHMVNKITRERKNLDVSLLVISFNKQFTISRRMVLKVRKQNKQKEKNDRWRNEQ